MDSAVVTNITSTFGRNTLRRKQINHQLINYLLLYIAIVSLHCSLYSVFFSIFVAAASYHYSSSSLFLLLLLLLLSVYRKGDNSFYDTNQFLSVLVCDPSIFDPSVEMQHMRAAIGKGLREHEIIQKKFEVSGTHTELIDDLYVISDSDFKKFVSTSDGEALYLNCFFNLYPEVIQAAVGTLPPGVFRESTDFKKNLCQPRHSKRPRKTKRDLKNEKVISALDRYNGIQASRAQAEIE